MTTPPVVTAPPQWLPQSLVEVGGVIQATVDLQPGQIVYSTAGDHLPQQLYAFEFPVPECCIVTLTTDDVLVLERNPFMAKLLTASHAVHPNHGNCHMTGTADAPWDTIRVTRPVSSGSPLLLSRCEVSALTQDMPIVMNACTKHICQAFMTQHVPDDSCALAGHPAGNDGYTTFGSMVRIACHAPWCTASAVIGCGYGETAALLALFRQESCTGFEMFQERVETARSVVASANLSERVRLLGKLASFEDPWSDSPTLLWSNNYRFNDDPKSQVIADLLALPHYPSNTSVMLSMVPFLGEVDVPMCFCGNCYEDFCDHMGVYGCHILRPHANVQIDSSSCGPRRGFASGQRIILRVPHSSVVVEPYGAGKEAREACSYQFFTCTDHPPTPHEGILYENVLLESSADLTDQLRADLAFVSKSKVVGGPMEHHSLIFHGEEGELLGIDMAIVFIAREPGAAKVAFGYRTLARVRDCGISGTMRVNHDVILPSMQGRSFINQANLITSQVLRAKFPDVTSLVLEPDTEIGYHRNYEAHGFLWRLQEPLVCTLDFPPRVSRAAFQSYRQQIGLDSKRYPSLWIALPVENTATAKRTKYA